MCCNRLYIRLDKTQDMVGKPLHKIQCDSMTRGSKYTVRCKAKGYLMKSGFYRCKNHGGMSDWNAKTIEGKIRALRNLKFLKHLTEDELRAKYIKQRDPGEEISTVNNT